MGCEAKYPQDVEGQGSSRGCTIHSRVMRKPPSTHRKNTKLYLKKSEMILIILENSFLLLIKKRRQKSKSIEKRCTPNELENFENSVQHPASIKTDGWWIIPAPPRKANTFLIKYCMSYHARRKKQPRT